MKVKTKKIEILLDEKDILEAVREYLLSKFVITKEDILEDGVYVPLHEDHVSKAMLKEVYYINEQADTKS